MSTSLQREELSEMSRVNDGVAALYLASDWISIFALVGVSNWAPVWSYPFLVLLMARQQHALGVLVHESVHFALFSRRFLNDVVGQIFAAAPIFFSVATFRYVHLRHHLHPLSDKDPDLVLNGGYPKTLESVSRKILRDLTGRTHYKIVRAFNFETPAYRTEPRLLRYRWSTCLVVNAVLLAMFSLIAGPWAYLLFWIVPHVFILPLMLRVRGVCEHGGYTPDKDQARNSRTLIAPLYRFFFAPHAVGFHTAHHLFPSIPHYRLSRAHAVLLQRGRIPAERVYTSSLRLWRELVR